MKISTKGEYGIRDRYIGVPAVIGAKGVERIIEIDLNKAEQKMFENSVASVLALCEACIAIAPWPSIDAAYSSMCRLCEG